MKISEAKRLPPPPARGAKAALRIYTRTPPAPRLAQTPDGSRSKRVIKKMRIPLSAYPAGLPWEPGNLPLRRDAAVFLL